jgi:NADH dehydrogenase
MTHKKCYDTIIIGGGFAGLNAAVALGKKKKEVLLIDKTNHHLFQPLLYQVATAGLSPANIASPIREILKPYTSITVFMDKLIDIDQQHSAIHTESGKSLTFNNLIIAVGVRQTYFGHDHWAENAPGLKSLIDALKIRESILRSFEMAELSDNQSEIDANTTFVVIGAGPTGVEMAGAIAEISRQTLAKNFSSFDPRNTRVYLVEGGDRVLPSFKENLSARAKKDLEKMGVRVELNSLVEDIDADGVTVSGEKIYTKNVVWGAGNLASPLLKKLDQELDKMGRVIVEKDCSIRGHANIFVIGDGAAFEENGEFLPGLAPVAVQQGRYVAKIIQKNMPKGKRNHFKYFDKGSMATIGMRKAVLEVGNVTMAGFSAWAAWCFVHLLSLVMFRSRILVLIDWINCYFTGQRGARIIKDDFRKL